MGSPTELYNNAKAFAQQHIPDSPQYRVAIFLSLAVLVTTFVYFCLETDELLVQNTRQEVYEWNGRELPNHVEVEEIGWRADELDTVDVKDWKNVSVLHSVVGKRCHRNTGILIQRMRNTQRMVARQFYKYITNVTERYRRMPKFFGPAMNGFRYALRPFRYYSQDEYKYFLEFSDPTSNCNHITLGVGGSWDGEKALRKKYPQCRMMGVDPVDGLSRSEVESDPNSRFVLAAVADKAWVVSDASIKGTDGQYTNQSVPTRGFVELMIRENEGRVVDFLTMDVEGAEFGILNLLHKKRNQLPPICQFNVEIHYRTERYGIPWENVDKTLKGILNEGHFIMLNIDDRSFRLKRAFFVNIEDEECIQKFLC